MSMRHAGGGGLVDQPSLAEALEGKRRGDRVRFSFRHRPGEYLRGAGRRLETTRAPAAVHEEPAYLRYADDGRPVRRHVDDATPVTQHPKAPEAGEQDRKSTRLNSSH